jgi:hypothetical protein
MDSFVDIVANPSSPSAVDRTALARNRPHLQDASANTSRMDEQMTNTPRQMIVTHLSELPFKYEYAGARCNSFLYVAF